MILPAVHLTPRQLQVITLIAQGLSYCQIAAGLGISTRTVRYHAYGAITALQAPNLHSAIARAAHLGLILPEHTFNIGGEGIVNSNYNSVDSGDISKASWSINNAHGAEKCER